MNHPARPILTFCTAAAITAVAWSIGSSEKHPPVTTQVEVLPSIKEDPRWPSERTEATIGGVLSATTDEAKLQASGRLLEIPLEDIHEALEFTLAGQNRLNLACKVLLIRWAAADGPSAADWAWKRFRSNGLWDDAFREIIPAWAARRPASLGKWAVLAHERTKPFGGGITVVDAETSELPLLDSGMLTDIAGWLVTEDPHLAYQLIVLRGGFSSDDMKIPMSIHTVAKVREALLAFDNLDSLDPSKSRGTDTAAMMLLMRWKELDPADFNRTPHARLFDRPAVTNHGEVQVKPLATRDLDAALEQMDLLDPARRPVEFVSIFDAWTAANPDTQPEISGWPPARLQAWRDLEALKPVDR